MRDLRIRLRATYDPAVDAAYFRLQADIEVGGVAQTVPLDPAGIGGMINLDFDKEGRLLGIEVLGAKDKLPVEALKQLRNG